MNYICDLDHHLRKSDTIVGIVIRLHELIYFLPIDSLDKTDVDEQGNIRKSTPSIMRMIDAVSQNGIGKCLLSNMFPIPYKEVECYAFDETQEISYPLLLKKLEYAQKNITRIEKAAQRLYKQKIKGYQQAYLNETADFEMLERAAYQWEIDHYQKHCNRFPDSQYFLTNPNTEGYSEYYFMNKNTKIANVKIHNSTQKIVEIIEILHPEYAPLECYKDNQLTADEISSWFKGRGIPSWREGLDDFLDNIGIKNKDMLLNKAFGLSLSDQYWMNPVDLPMDWKDINFFDHNFNSYDFLEATFENRVLELGTVDFYTPNNTSDGMLKKAWIVGNDGKRYLLKGSYHQKGQEPLNEVLASMICEVIDLNYVPYEIDTSRQQLLSKCECFVNRDTELISAYAVLKHAGVNFNHKDEDIYNKYISILQENGITDVESKLAKMFILDYLIGNVDRHLGNFGILRNVETLQWLDVAPNFDSGQAMFSQKEIYEMDFNHISGCFFNKKDIDFDNIYDLAMKHIHIVIDFKALIQVAEKWKQCLLNYQYLSGFSDERIEILYQGFLTRIKKLKALYKKS